MVLEHVSSTVVEGQEAAYEEAFAKASQIIRTMPGFISLRLERCLEKTSQYVLLIEWETLEDHMVGFRNSPEFQQWRELLHHFYVPTSVVEHYQTVTRI